MRELLFNHYLFTVYDIHSLLRGVGVELATTEVIPEDPYQTSPRGGFRILPLGGARGGYYSRHFAVEVQHNVQIGCAAVRAAGGEAVQLEVGALGTDAGTALRPVQLVGAATPVPS